ncbi:hypothetical protein [Entomomonas asaccharolytica]|uniref:Uncharacterized protein n=1 Tax=Entomomonas asaccharolytica TaxID=2785331 RepID=A0A974RXG7_9GAMM|nr:hypothetical protein [Entomomonas asaccharolytica]QQP86208.1 hypothetical protein JHT90_02905 [Entomomonas asaccharolytica]
MRNDLKDEPIDVPSLTLDEHDQFENTDHDSRDRARSTKLSRLSNRTVVYMLLFLFVVYSIGMVVLFWVFKQAADDVRYQLDEKTHTTSTITENNMGRLQAITEQFNSQQTVTKNQLENIRAQNKQLVTQLNRVLETQQTITTKQETQEKRLAKLEEQLVALAKTTNQIEQVKQLQNEIAEFKKMQPTITRLTNDVDGLKKQNGSQTLKSVQDDLLLLRSQLDNVATNNDSKQQLEALQNKVDNQLQKMQQQLDNRSPY